MKFYYIAILSLIFISCGKKTVSQTSAESVKLKRPDINFLLKQPKIEGYKCSLSNDRLSKKVFVYYQNESENKYYMRIEDFMAPSFTEKSGAKFAGFQFLTGLNVSSNPEDNTMTGSALLFLDKNSRIDYPLPLNSKVLEINAKIKIDNVNTTAEIEYKLLIQSEINSLSETEYMPLGKLEDCVKHTVNN